MIDHVNVEAIRAEVKHRQASGRAAIGHDRLAATGRPQQRESAAPPPGLPHWRGWLALLLRTPQRTRSPRSGRQAGWQG